MVTDIKEENEAIVEQWVREAQSADEPGDSLKSPIIHKGDDELQAPARIHSLKSAGYSYVYHTETGDRSVVNNNMLRMQLRKKLPNGNPAFSVHPPKDAEGNIIKPVAGTFKCLLHPDNPNRAMYDQMGFPVCNKSNLTSEFQVRRHMQKRHKMEWEAIEQMRIEAEKKEDRDLQKSLYQSVIGKASSENPSDRLDAMTHPLTQECIVAEVMDNVEEAPLYVSDKPQKHSKPKKKKK